MATANRITYIDALRGFTMILVVMNHVSAYCLGVPYTISDLANGCYTFTPFFREFRMPLFFFISGFVLYKASVIWDGKHIVSFFKKKIPVQLLSPFLFFMAYMFIFDIGFQDAIYHPFKKGYWFTLTLFEFYILYALAQFVLLKLKTNNILSDVCIVVWGFVVMGLSIYVFRNKVFYDLIGSETWHYFIYFVFGTLTRKYFKQFELMLDKGIIIVLSVVAFFGINMFYTYLPPYVLFIFPTHTIVGIILALSGIVIVFSFFRRHCNHQSVNTHQSSDVYPETKSLVSDFQLLKAAPLQFIGRRTLDIYLLHYFLLPKQLSNVLTIFSEHAMPLLELVVSFLISLIVVVACILIGSILRLTPQMAHWLFGAKLEKK